jgi:hypothetical protein
MKRLAALFTCLLLSMVLSSPAHAGDREDVLMAVNAYNASMRDGNTDVYVNSVLPGYIIYNGGGALLNYNPPANRSGIQTAFDAGTRFNIQHRHQEVVLYGDTAILTAYEQSTTILADGTSTAGRPFRTTMVWVKQGGTWKMAHQHQSPLLPPSP